MNKIAIIGGTGLTALEGIKVNETKELKTPYGNPSHALIHSVFGEKEIIFLPRHGDPHRIPPHKINYRANIYALKKSGVQSIIAVNAVGGVTSEMYPCRPIVPNQIIDYTYLRKHTYFETDLKQVTHIDFTHPYCEKLRHHIIQAANNAKIDIQKHGTYGIAQGPRLETIAEVKRMEKDGCDIVGMTGMPEASLARELEIDYVCLSLVVNWGAGKSEEKITMKIIENNLKTGMSKIKTILEETIKLIS